MRKLKLPNITLVFVADNRLKETSHAIDYSVRGVDFASVKWFTSKKPSTKNCEWVKINSIVNGEAYNKFIIQELNSHVATDYCIIAQWDGYVVNPLAWNDLFYSYDYIGAPWNDANAKSYGGSLEDKHRVGNGGFSFRSKKLLEKCANSPFKEFMPEDCMIVKKYRCFFEDMNFASFPIANQFSQDDFPYGYNGVNAFGFHGKNKLNNFQ